MGRLRQVARSETDDPIVNGMYDLLFGKGVDPVAEQKMGTATGSEGDWWTTYALSPDIMEHAVAGFVLYRSPDRKLDGVLRELAQSRIGWAVGSKFVFSQHVQALRGLKADPAKIAGIIAWQTSDAYTPVERAVLALRRRHRLRQRAGQRRPLRGAPGASCPTRRSSSSPTSSAMYLQHAVITRALRLEWDDRPEPVEEVDPPEDFDAEHYMKVGSNREAKQQLRDARR